MESRRRRHDDSTGAAQEIKVVVKTWNRVSPRTRWEKVNGRGSTSLKKKGPAPTLMAAWHPWMAPILLGVLDCPPLHPSPGPASSAAHQLYQLPSTHARTHAHTHSLPVLPFRTASRPSFS